DSIGNPIFWTGYTGCEKIKEILSPVLILKEKIIQG
ncbi:unnamed protein product, partial [marine sediment metagenome]